MNKPNKHLIKQAEKIMSASLKLIHQLEDDFVRTATASRTPIAVLEIQEELSSFLVLWGQTAERRESGLQAIEPSAEPPDESLE